MVLLEYPRALATQFRTLPFESFPGSPRVLTNWPGHRSMTWSPLFAKSCLYDELVTAFIYKVLRQEKGLVLHVFSRIWQALAKSLCKDNFVPFASCRVWHNGRQEHRTTPEAWNRSSYRMFVFHNAVSPESTLPPKPDSGVLFS